MTLSELLNSTKGRPAHRAILAQVNRGATMPAQPKAKPVKLDDGYHSQWEREYAAQLELRRKAGEVVSFARTLAPLILADRTTYTPDFLVVFPNGSAEFVEVKGFARDDAIVKFKVAADRYPHFVFRMVKKVGGAWETTRLLNAPAEGSIK